MNTKSTIISVLAVVACSCSVDVRKDWDPDVELCFQPAMYMQVDGQELGDYPLNEEFGVSAWTEADGKAVTSDIRVLPGEGSWSCEGGRLWPARGEKLGFIAYAPYGKASECSLEKGVRFDNVDVLKDQTDLLYTDIQGGLEKMECGGVATVPFRHALCQISFRAGSSKQPEERIVLKRISIEQVSHCGSFCSVSKPQWNITGDRKEVVFFEGSKNVTSQPVSYGKSLLVLPQELDTVISVEVEFFNADGTSINQTLKTVDIETALEPGLHYVYTLSLSFDRASVQTELIEHHYDYWI